jgi:uncharacterized protein YbjT (DUF2867 family)
MPVVVIGAGGLVGRSLLLRLAEAGGEVRALVAREDEIEAVRGLVPKVAAVDLDDVEHLTTVFHDAHTVVHLGSSEGVGWVAAAAEEAKVTRLLVTSGPATGRVAETVEASSVPQRVVVRTAPVYGPGISWLEALRSLARAPIALLPVDPDLRVAPLFYEDLVAVLVAADDRGGPVSGTFALAGPDPVSVRELVSRLAGRRRHPFRVGFRRGRTWLETVLAAPTPEGPDAAAEFGVELTPLREGLSRSA